MSRVLIADDNDVFREMLQSHLETQGSFAVEAVADLPQALGAICASGSFDLVLLDLQMPGMNGVAGLKQAIDANGGRPVALMSGLVPDQLVDEGLAQGCAGFLPKAQMPSSVVAAVWAMMAGEVWLPSDRVPAAPSAPAPPPGRRVIGLTGRERQVLATLCAGHDNRAIAAQLTLHEPTIKLHVKMICSKLQARNPAHAIMIACDEGLC